MPTQDLNDDFFLGDSQKQAIDRIRAFLKAPGLPSGGVLLVTGLRGVGKTRLVDRALNTRREYERPNLAPVQASASQASVGSPHCQIHLWLLQLWRIIIHGYLRSNFAGRILAPLSGHDPHRIRLLSERKPRGTKRLILPIAVDPFFPEAARSDKGPPSDKPEMDRDVLALIRNMVFGLTSTIDARHSVRRYGRTLSAWLGWWTLWFNPSVLLRPQQLPGWLGVGIWTLLAFLGGLITGYLLTTLVIPISFCLSNLFYFPCSLLLAWIILRYLDLRGLRLMGSQLYDLVHAQSMSMEIQMELERSMRADAKWQGPIRALGFALLLAFAGFAWFGLGEMNKGPSQQAYTSTASTHQPGPPSNPASQSTSSKIPAVSTAPSKSQNTPFPSSKSDSSHANSTPQANSFDIKDPKAWLLGILGITGALALGYAGLSRKRRHATFGTENRAWMITLLRRYLYQLHRAGFEPVLVVDEIDKLEGSPTSGSGVGKGGEGNDGKETDQSQKPSVSEFDRFVHSLVRLKQSLGAEFIWILIDSDRLIERVVRDRRSTEGTGHTGTLIQDEVLIGPIPFEDFRHYALQRLESKPGWSHEWLLPHWWLMAGGGFFQLRRLVSEVKADLISIPNRNSDRERRADILIKAVQYLTERNFDHLSEFGQSPGPTQKALREILELSQWHRDWVLMGVIDLARRLYDPQLVPPSYGEFDEKMLKVAMTPSGGYDNPQTLMGVGRAALFEFLVQTHEHGDPTLGIDDGCGIDSAEGLNKSLRIRLKIRPTG